MEASEGKARRSERKRKRKESYSPDGKKDTNGVKKSRSKSRANRPYDVLPNGEPFSCHLCKSPYVVNTLIKSSKKTGRSSHTPLPKVRIDKNTGGEIMLCNACVQIYDRPPRRTTIRTISVPSEEEKKAYINDVECFIKMLRSQCDDPLVERLFCPLSQKKICGCLQKCIKSNGESSTELVHKLIGLIKEAVELRKEKAYPVAVENKKSRVIGLGNGHKKSKQYETFVFTKRQYLREDMHLCERATQKILLYSNNFLHKRLKTENRPCRIERTRGRAALGKLPDFQKMRDLHCCMDNCVMLAMTHKRLLQDWRSRALQGQSEARRVVAEMLTPAGALHTNCYSFISMVSGCCLATISSVYNQMMDTGGVRDPPEHGMKRVWQEHYKRNKTSTEAIISQCVASKKVSSDQSCPRVVSPCSTVTSETSSITTLEKAAKQNKLLWFQHIAKSQLQQQLAIQIQELVSQQKMMELAKQSSGRSTDHSPSSITTDSSSAISHTLHGQGQSDEQPGESQGQSVLCQGQSQGQQDLCQSSGQGRTILCQDQPQRQPVLFQGQSQGLLSQSPGQGQTVLFQGQPQGQRVLCQGPSPELYDQQQTNTELQLISQGQPPFGQGHILQGSSSQGHVQQIVLQPQSQYGMTPSGIEKPLQYTFHVDLNQPNYMVTGDQQLVPVIPVFKYQGQLQGQPQGYPGHSHEIDSTLPAQQSAISQSQPMVIVAEQQTVNSNPTPQLREILTPNSGNLPPRTDVRFQMETTLQMSEPHGSVTPMRDYQIMTNEGIVVVQAPASMANNVSLNNGAFINVNPNTAESVYVPVSEAADDGNIDSKKRCVNVAINTDMCVTKEASIVVSDKPVRKSRNGNRSEKCVNVSTNKEPARKIRNSETIVNHLRSVQNLHSLNHQPKRYYDDESVPVHKMVKIGQNSFPEIDQNPEEALSKPAPLVNRNEVTHMDSVRTGNFASTVSPVTFKSNSIMSPVAFSSDPSVTPVSYVPVTSDPTVTPVSYVPVTSDPTVTPVSYVPVLDSNSEANEDLPSQIQISFKTCSSTGDQIGLSQQIVMPHSSVVTLPLIPMTCTESVGGSNLATATYQIANSPIVKPSHMDGCDNSNLRSVNTVLQHISDNSRSVNTVLQHISDNSRSVGTVPQHISDNSRSVGTVPQHISDNSRPVGTVPQHISDNSRSLGTVPQHISDNSRPLGSNNSRPDGSDNSRPVGSDNSRPVGSDNSRPVGSDNSRPVGSDNSRPVGSDNSRPVGSDNSRPVGSDNSRPVGSDNSRPVGSDNSRPVGSDNSRLDDTVTTDSAKVKMYNISYDDHGLEKPDSQFSRLKVVRSRNASGRKSRHSSGSLEKVKKVSDHNQDFYLDAKTDHFTDGHFMSKLDKIRHRQMSGNLEHEDRSRKSSGNSMISDSSSHVSGLTLSNLASPNIFLDKDKGIFFMQSLEFSEIDSGHVADFIQAVESDNAGII